MSDCNSSAVTAHSAEQFNFRSDGPALASCDKCSKGFQDWEVTPEQWELIPTYFQSYVLCEDCYAELVKGTGNDPAAIQITHNTWDNLMKEWEEDSKDAPPHHAVIYFEASPEYELPGESMWCEVLQRQPNGEFVVRLRSTSLFSRKAAESTRFLAYWDGAIHRPSGRALLTAIRNLNERSPELHDNIKVKVRTSQDEDVVIDARHLGSRLALVFSSVRGITVRPGDIVRLSNDPSEGQAMPEVTEIVYKPNPRWSRIEFDTPEAKERIQALAVALGADIAYTVEPSDDAPGEMLVCQRDDVDFEMVVDAAGIPQYEDVDEDDEDVDEDEAQEVETSSAEDIRHNHVSGESPDALSTAQEDSAN